MQRSESRDGRKMDEPESPLASIILPSRQACGSVKVEDCIPSVAFRSTPAATKVP